MRLKLMLECPKNSALAFEHHYALQAVIYRIIERADTEFSHFLHESGYTTEGKKRFKLFTFGLLVGRPFLRDNAKSHIVFPSGIVEWQISFQVPQQVEKFVSGLFQNQTFDLVADDTKVVFRVKSVEVMSPPPFSDTMRFRAISGICLTEKGENDRYAQFRSPDDAQFKDLFFGNLTAKAQAAFGEDFKMPPPQYLDIKVLSEPKKWSTKVPSKTVGQKPTRTIGYRFDFEIKAPKDWLEMGYNAGFGGKNAGGFGFCEVLK